MNLLISKMDNLIKEVITGTMLLVVFSLLFSKPMMAQGTTGEKYLPHTIVCTNPNHTVQDTILITYDWANRITRINSKVGSHAGKENRFETQITYNNEGLVASLTESPLSQRAGTRQEYRFGYRGVFLDKIWFDQGEGEEFVTVQYSAPTNTYNLDYKGSWQNFVFDDGDLVATRIKGYEVFNIHRDKEARSGVFIHVKQRLPIALVAQTLGGSQLIWYVLSNYQVDLLILNDQNIFIETRRDEFGRIAQLDFSSEELGTFQTTNIHYKTIK